MFIYRSWVISTYWRHNKLQQDITPYTRDTHFTSRSWVYLPLTLIRIRYAIIQTPSHMLTWLDNVTSRVFSTYWRHNKLQQDIAPYMRDTHFTGRSGVYLTRTLLRISFVIIQTFKSLVNMLYTVTSRVISTYWRHNKSEHIRWLAIANLHDLEEI